MVVSTNYELYDSLLNYYGFKNVTSKDVALRTNEVFDYTLKKWSITLDGINIILLKDGTKVFDLPLCELELEMTIAYCLIADHERDLLYAFNPRHYLNHLKRMDLEFRSLSPDNHLDELIMEVMFKMQIIRQNLNK